MIFEEDLRARKQEAEKKTTHDLVTKVGFIKIQTTHKSIFINISG